MGAHARTHVALTAPFLKRNHTLSQDEARILPRFRPPDELVARARLERAQGRALASVATPGVAPVSAGGDPVALRGIPAVGVRGVGGAIRGTSPHQAIDRLPDGPLVAFA